MRRLEPVYYKKTRYIVTIHDSPEGCELHVKKHPLSITPDEHQNIVAFRCIPRKHKPDRTRSTRWEDATYVLPIRYVPK